MNVQMVTIRTLCETDLERAFHLSQSVGWPHRIDDWQMMRSLGRGFVADFAGEVVGTAMHFDYGDQFSSLGMIIVAPDMQGRGIGRQLLQSLQASCEGRVLALNSTPAGKSLYESSGFKPAGKIQQFQGETQTFCADQTKSISTLDETNISEVVHFDFDRTALDRSRTIQQLLRVGIGFSYKAGSNMLGYGIVRRFGLGHLIGPVVATEEGAAHDITQRLIREVNGFVRIDTTTAGSGLESLLKANGLKCVSSVVSMTFTPPHIDRRPSEQQYAVASQALG